MTYISAGLHAAIDHVGAAPDRCTPFIAPDCLSMLPCGDGFTLQGRLQRALSVGATVGVLAGGIACSLPTVFLLGTGRGAMLGAADKAIALLGYGAAGLPEMAASGAATALARGGYGAAASCLQAVVLGLRSLLLAPRLLALAATTLGALVGAAAVAAVALLVQLLIELCSVLARLDRAVRPAPAPQPAVVRMGGLESVALRGVV